MKVYTSKDVANALHALISDNELVLFEPGAEPLVKAYMQEQSLLTCWAYSAFLIFTCKENDGSMPQLCEHVAGLANSVAKNTGICVERPINSFSVEEISMVKEVIESTPSLNLASRQEDLSLLPENFPDPWGDRQPIKETKNHEH